VGHNCVVRFQGLHDPRPKATLTPFLQTFSGIFKKSKLMQQKIQKKPQAAGTNEEEHETDEEQQFDPEADFL
jgi:hypothetical protein